MDLILYVWAEDITSVTQPKYIYWLSHLYIYYIDVQQHLTTPNLLLLNEERGETYLIRDNSQKVSHDQA